ncbi:hypothetical protein M8C21_000374 [Ambrosia artemisiifolia]|uniref:Uncharacterized protein n=1 Tax=Ambrosia artemisiifolia TaxID=4212 RepID=A0AAD5CVT1_AMBAR|nr:hypothetical protein M8C21_000374 [Ambrosia artemisiifolia]
MGMECRWLLDLNFSDYVETREIEIGKGLKQGLVVKRSNLKQMD